MIDYKIKQAMIVVATKPLIDWLLSLNTHNRAPKRSAIDWLHQSIDDGQWFLTNQGVGITASGWITDGQHRLIAIADAGYPPVEFVLVTGLKDEAQAVVDRHAKRSQADVIKLFLNQTVTNQAVAVANVIFRVRTDGESFSFINKRPSDFEIAGFISDNAEALSRIMPCIGSGARAAVAAAIVHYSMSYDFDAACEFADKVRTGVGLTATDPAYRLRLWLENHRAGGAQSQVEHYSATATACIAHARGESLNMIRLSASWDRLPKRRQSSGFMVKP